MPSLIMHDDLFRSAFVIIGTQETITNFPFENLIDISTANQAGFAVGASRKVIIDLGNIFPFDTLCIAKHNLGSMAATLYIDYLVPPDESELDNWVNAFTIAPTTDFVIFSRDSIIRNARYIRVRVANHDGDVYISNMQFGLALEIDTGQGIGFLPPEQSTNHEVIANVTRGNELAGVIRVEKPYSTTFSIRHVDNSWFITNWVRLARGITTYPFYFLWETGKRPIYCWVRGQIGQPNFSSLRHQSVEVSVEGFV